MTKKIFHQNRRICLIKPLQMKSRLQEKPEKPSVLKFLIFLFFFLLTILACLDPDPDWEHTDPLTHLNPDPICFEVSLYRTGSCYIIG
jgi:hypothetical protein